MILSNISLLSDKNELEQSEAYEQSFFGGREAGRNETEIEGK